MGHLKTGRTQLLSLALVVAGNVLYALTAKFFLLQANLMSCGTTGLALAVNAATDFPIPLFIFLLNVAMLLLGWWLIGRQFALTTVFSSLFYPAALAALDALFPAVYITDSTLLNVLFAGLGLGASLGMVMRGGASTGGLDIPPLILRKYFRIPVSATLWALDFLVLLLQMAYHTLEDLLYGIVLLIVISMTLNRVLLLGTSRTEVKIVSSRAREIRDAILSQVDRGVTLLHGEGGYLHDPTEVILSIVSNHEMPKIEALARGIDPECFMIVSHVTEVWGRGFSQGKRWGNRKPDAPQ